MKKSVKKVELLSDALMVQSMQRPPSGARSLNEFYSSTFYSVQSHTTQMQEKSLHSDGNI